MSLGNKIKTARYMKNYTQEYMADLLKVSQKTYSNFENDKTEPTLSQLEKISEELEISILELLQDAVYITNNGGENSSNQQGLVFYNCPENLIKQYENRIQDLQEEVEYLKSVINKFLEK